MKIIALEEHFVTQPIMDAWLALPADEQDPAVADAQQGETNARLLNFGADRIADMSEAGVDMQVLSMTTPGVQNLDAETAVSLQVEANDILATVVRSHPDRFQGFATLATPDPAAAASELERAVRQLNLDGAMLMGRTGDKSLDHKDLWPIYETAERLRAPLYIHPQSPPQVVRGECYNGLGEEIDRIFERFAIGWHYEAGIQVMRMILGGVFDAFPKLQVITGHWGEVVTFYLDRIDVFKPFAHLPRAPSDYFRSNILITNSGIYSQRYLQWAIDVIGIDRIMFATDYPYAPTPKGIGPRFLEEADLSREDRDKIAFGNWERLRSKIRRKAA